MKDSPLAAQGIALSGLGGRRALVARQKHRRRRSTSTASRSASAFCRQPANFEIGDAPIAYSPTDSFVRAILVGLANTARVSVLGWIFAIALGFVLGVLRLAHEPGGSRRSARIVELVRNVPLLLLLFLLAATMHTLPAGPGGAGAVAGRVRVGPRARHAVVSIATGWSIDRPHLQGFNFVGG